jgi:hypothetical protein
MKTSQLINMFSAEFGTPIEQIQNWVDDDGRVAIEPMAGFLVKQYEPKKGTWTIGFRSKGKDSKKRTLVGPYDLRDLPKIANFLYNL